MFDMSNIKTFELEDLSGKTLRIQSSKSEGIVTVLGRDVETNDIYVLKQEEIKS